MADPTTRCASCGGVVRLDHAACPACGAARSRIAGAPAPKPALPRPVDLEIEVYARLMWGEAPQQVRAQFLRLGAKPSEFDPLLRMLEQRRRDHYRKLGVRDLALGIGLLALGIGVIAVTWFWVQGELEGQRFDMWLVIGAAVVPVGGILLILRGVKRVSRPGEGEREEGEELEDDD
jgi:hypothetical protein